MIVASPQAMREVGHEFSARLRPGDIVAITGGLGAGKTVFCKGVLEGCGYRGEVASPTFNIVNHYEPPDVALAIIHADLYRLTSPQELDELGLNDSDAICLIEWAEQGGPAMERADYRVRIGILDDMRREVVIEGMGSQQHGS